MLSEKKMIDSKKSPKIKKCNWSLWPLYCGGVTRNVISNIESKNQSNVNHFKTRMITSIKAKKNRSD